MHEDFTPHKQKELGVAKIIGSNYKCYVLQMFSKIFDNHAKFTSSWASWRSARGSGIPASISQHQIRKWVRSSSVRAKNAVVFTQDNANPERTNSGPPAPTASADTQQPANPLRSSPRYRGI